MNNKAIILTLVSVALLASCSQVRPTGPTVNVGATAPVPSKAEQSVLDEGYTEPKVIGTPMLSCGKEDSILTSKTIKAKNVNGKEVKLTVCCGLLFKGCTIRH